MRPIDIVRRLCPRARPEYVAAFEAGDAAIREAGISTPKRLAHFLAQVFHETGGLTITEENMRYSAHRMMEVWPKRFPTLESARPYAWDPSDPDREDIALANKTYGGRMGNEDNGTDDDDGWRYRGRGVMQTTGRDAYRKYGKRWGVDFEANPDLILSAEYALAPALAEWVDGRCNAKADNDDLRGITLTINGGYTGLASRMNWLQRIRAEMVGKDLEPPRAAPQKPAGGNKPSASAKTAAASTVAVSGTAAAAVQAGVPWGWVALAVAVVAVAGIAYLVWRNRK